MIDLMRCSPSTEEMTGRRCLIPVKVYEEDIIELDRSIVSTETSLLVNGDG